MCLSFVIGAEGGAIVAFDFVGEGGVVQGEDVFVIVEVGEGEGVKGGNGEVTGVCGVCWVLVKG